MQMSVSSHLPAIRAFPGKGSHANYERPGEHTRLMGLADDLNDDKGFSWNKKARLVVPYPRAVLHYGGRLSRHVVNAWEQVRETGKEYLYVISKECFSCRLSIREVRVTVSERRISGKAQLSLEISMQ